MVWLEYFGVLTGLLYLFLEIRQHRAMWVVGFLTSLVYVFVFFFSKIYADMGLQTYYVAISIYGFCQWTRKGMKNNSGKQDSLPSDCNPLPHMTSAFRRDYFQHRPCLRHLMVCPSSIHRLADTRRRCVHHRRSALSPPGCWHGELSSTGSSGSSSTSYPSIFITCVGSIPQCFSIFATRHWRQPDYTLGGKREEE